MHSQTLIRSLVLAGALALPLRAQSFNVDFGALIPSVQSFSPVPSTGYGAAAGQMGVWNGVGSPNQVFLNDLAGSPTAVSLHYYGEGSLPPGNFQTSALDIPSVSGDLAALMEDWAERSNNGGEQSGVLRIDVANLVNGQYEVFTYSHHDLLCPSTVVVEGAVDPLELVTGSIGGDHARGLTYARHRLTVTNGTIHVAINGTAPCGIPFEVLATCSGLQIVKLDGSNRTICAGDGTAGACPCGNYGASGRGCANSFDATGARIIASGTASVSADSLVLTADGVSNSFVTFFQGTQAVNGGSGVVLGDGLLCASGSLTRLVMRLANNQSTSYPVLGDIALATLGGLEPAGSSRIYQIFYRDSFAFCTSATFNTTNAVEVSWGP